MTEIKSSPEMIWLYDKPAEDVFCLATDISAFQGWQNKIWTERIKLGPEKVQKSSV